MRVLLAAILILCAVRVAASEAGLGVLRTPTSPPDQAVDENDLSDREPVDPAEQRPAVSPPKRVVARGAQPSGIIILPPIWTFLGPAPTQGAQVVVPPDHEVSGAVHALAPHPTNANILYVASVNGGVWRTANATAADPDWTPLTDFQRSLSTASIAFDRNDASFQTLVVGTGRVSNFAQRGDDEIGIYRTTDGGSSWTELGEATLLGQKLIGVSARGAVLMAASRNGGLYRSTNTGGNWTLVSGGAGTGLPAGGIGELAEDPTNNNRFYVGVLGSATPVWRTSNGGATWEAASTGITSTATSGGNIRISVGAGGVVFAAIVSSSTLTGVFRSTNQGGNWTAMDVPAVHPGGQGSVNTSLAAHPSNNTLVFIGGDRITAYPFTGNVRRGDSSAASGSQFTAIMDAGGNNTAPHADSRDLAFDASGSLLESDDGGVYRRSNPTGAGTWTSVIGDLGVMEVHDLDHDGLANVITIGTQDNGTHMQQLPNTQRWEHIFGGDGGDVAIDDITLVNGSYRYISSQSLGSFTRQRYSNANLFVSELAMPGITGAQFVTPVEINRMDPARLMVGGSSQIFISTNATSAAPTYSLQVAPGANRNAMVYGAFGNTDAAYVGKGSQVYRRSGNTFVATTVLPAGANTITDVTMDPENAARVWAIDDNQVFRSINSGTTWVDVTGNLPSISSFDFRTIEYIPENGTDRLALGTRSGVYFVDVDDDAWYGFGILLPDVLVFDLRFIQSTRRLIAGTLGRGVWSVIVPQRQDLFANGFE
ncbi:MAG: hypothetical protein IT479_02450 [Xanthomonadales bacterium]|nr:hypothetical protein [Xanthomonadales bacterium]MCC6592109.1 hypothetical protein [Xanthomonadales bacterium]MCE7931395.1 hypothetical protein [Xanthomonadales bacterium PRO6]